MDETYFDPKLISPSSPLISNLFVVYRQRFSKFGQIQFVLPMYPRGPFVLFFMSVRSTLRS